MVMSCVKSRGGKGVGVRGGSSAFSRAAANIDSNLLQVQVLQELSSF